MTLLHKITCCRCVNITLGKSFVTMSLHYVIDCHYVIITLRYLLLHYVIYCDFIIITLDRLLSLTVCVVITISKHLTFFYVIIISFYVNFCFVSSLHCDIITCKDPVKNMPLVTLARAHED